VVPSPEQLWIALAGGFLPALIAVYKRRGVIRWYLYGALCALVAWPLLALPTLHALLVRWRDPPPKPSAQEERRAAALSLLEESSVRSYPSWIEDLTRKSRDGVDRRRYVCEHIGPGEPLELVREPANRSDGGSVAYCHRGVRLGYVPKRQRWIADALDDGLSLIAVAMKVKVGWINRRRAKFVATRIVVLSEGVRR